MSSAQFPNIPSARPQKRAREVADEGVDEGVHQRIRTSPTNGYTTATTYRPGGVGIGRNSVAAHNLWTKTNSGIEPSLALASSAVAMPQPYPTMTVPPVRPETYNTSSSAPGATSAQQPPPGITTAFAQQNHGKRPTLGMSNCPSAVSYLSSGVVAPMSLDRRAAHQPPTNTPPVSRGVYCPGSSGASMLSSPGARPDVDQQPARNGALPVPAVNPDLWPSLHQQQPSAGSSGTAHPGLHPRPHHIPTAAQSPRYQPNSMQKQWFDATTYQLQNPYLFVPGISPISPTPSHGALLHPYQVLSLRFLPPKERYKKYVEYHGLLTSIYGPSIDKTPQAINFLRTRLSQLSAWLIHTEQLQERDWQRQGVLQKAKEDRRRNYALAELGLGITDLPVSIGDLASRGAQSPNSPRVSHTPANPKQQNTHGSAPRLYMPNLNKVPSQVTAGRHNGYSSGTLPRGYTGEAPAASNPGLSPPATLPIGHVQGQAQGPAYEFQTPSTGHRASPAHFLLEGGAGLVKDLSVQNPQRASASYGCSSSAPIVIDDEDEPQQATVVQRSPGLNPAVKRGPAKEVIPPRKAPRIDSYTKPVDLTDDNGEKAAASPAMDTPLPVVQISHSPSQGPPTVTEVSPATQGSPPVRKTFEGSKDFEKYEAFQKEFEAKKQKVQNAMPGELTSSLATENNRGLYKHEKPWMAFNASRQREINEKEEAKRKAKEKEEKLKARREKDAATKKEKRKAEQAEKQRVAAQKARQEQRRIEKEETEAIEAAKRQKAEEEKAAKAKQQQEELKAATLQQQAQAHPDTDRAIDKDTFGDDDDDNDELQQVISGLLGQSPQPKELEEQAESLRDAYITTEKAIDNNSQEDAQSAPSIDITPEAVPEHDDLADLFEEEVEEASTTPDTTADDDDMSSLFEADDDDMRSLFGDDEVETDTPTTSPNDSLVLDQEENGKTSDTLTVAISAAAQSGEPGAAPQEQSRSDAPVNEYSEHQHADQSNVEDSPELAAKRLQIQALENDIAQKIAQASTTTNSLFKARLEQTIKKLDEERWLLEIEFAGGI
ncbi:uncharacterized protein N0V89_001960 [Didymosphaeria variabile]|uniref:Uncharacterized protein n=1 Tax=Didymosphaeria variabile TaxID=1932322 RepID=A0A9W8XQT3_9PLEO|nr:uncharacterized protein N0V89_001960 [Didymosphaeria variabile]KAJ4357385.1 hypothetical protein N0V89_001960 [Didymosphaeria variabile]